MYEITFTFQDFCSQNLHLPPSAPLDLFAVTATVSLATFELHFCLSLLHQLSVTLHFQMTAVQKWPHRSYSSTGLMPPTPRTSPPNPLSLRSFSRRVTLSQA